MLPARIDSRALVVLCVVAIASIGCQRETLQPAREAAFISEADSELRDQLGPETQVIGTLESGQRVEILETMNRWVLIRVEDDRTDERTGWVHQRQLVSQEIHDQFRRLADESEDLPSQGSALVFRLANLHSEPGRSTPVFDQLQRDEQVEVLRHGIAARQAGSVAPADASSSGDAAEPEVPAPEDWLLVRDGAGRTGWLLEPSVAMNPPLEVAQYREGLRIRAWFLLRPEMSDGREQPWVLWATTRRASVPYDFDEIRVFTWNPNVSRYETSLRERNLKGYFPIGVQAQNTPEEGPPSFQLELEDDEGTRFRKEYVMVGRQVRVIP